MHAHSNNTSWLGTIYLLLGYFLLTSFLPTTIGVEEGLRSFTASAIVTFVFEAWMSSRDGAVMRIVGGPEERWVDFDSVLDWEAAEIEGPKGSSIKEGKIHTTHHLTANMLEMHIILNNNNIMLLIIQIQIPF